MHETNSVSLFIGKLLFISIVLIIQQLWKKVVFEPLDEILEMTDR